MSTHPYRIRSLRLAAHDLGIGAVLLATIALGPSVAAAGDDAASSSATQCTTVGLVAAVDGGRVVLHRGTAPDLRLTVGEGTPVALDGRASSVSALRGGQEVRASYEETNGGAKALRIEAQSAQGQPVRTMSPDDPEWDQAHPGG
jgi:hypothetical protein